MRDVSQMAVVTGMNLRDVDQISAGMAPCVVQCQSSAAQVFTSSPALAICVCSPRDTCPTSSGVAPIAVRPEHPMWVAA
jgi:hypothetical protein